MTATPRRYVKDFTLVLGPIRLVGGLTPVLKPTKKPKVQYVCPVDGAKGEIGHVKQQYVCETHAEHGPFVPSELDRAVKGDEGWKRLEAEQVEEVRASTLPDNAFVANIHPRGSFEQMVRPSDKAYVFVPHLVDEMYSLLRNLVADSQYSFVAKTKVRGSESFYMLDVWGDNVIVQKLCWPAEVNQFDNPSDGEASTKVTEAAEGMLDRLSSDFKVDDYESEQYERLVEIAFGAEAVRKEQSPKDTSDELVSLLDAFGAA